MSALPSSIESALSDAGFSGTEILIVQRLLQEPAVTLRQLASKTGKSTGVLDQAMKKLLKRRIVNREIINEVPKYTLNSLESVARWIQEDVQSKRDALLRRCQNFESFIATLSVDKARPEMQYFEGQDGLQRAYLKLLEQGGELKEYFPVTCKEEEDPLRQFRVQYFRERRRRTIFTRVIAHDTPLGRRFQSRDPFAYRQTVLVPPESCPIAFEKIIAGDTVACFNHAEQRACFIRYGEFAKSELITFDLLWNANLNKSLPPALKVSQPPTKTRLVSLARGFILSRENIFISIGICLVMGFFASLMYWHTLSLIKQQIGNELMTNAVNAARQINPSWLEQIHFARDMSKQEYQSLFKVLNKTRETNPNIKYAYIYRPTEQEEIWEFVADADTNHNLPFEIDVNQNGVLEKDEEGTAPGTAYDLSCCPITREKGLYEPVYENDFTSDQWGTFLSASAPIRDINNRTVALIGLDADLSQVLKLTRIKFFVLMWIATILSVLLVIQAVRLHFQLRR